MWRRESWFRSLSLTRGRGKTGRAGQMLKPCIHCGKQLEISESEAADDFICTNCLYKVKWGIEDHIALLKERGLLAPKYSDHNQSKPLSSPGWLAGICYLVWYRYTQLFVSLTGECPTGMYNVPIRTRPCYMSANLSWLHVTVTSTIEQRRRRFNDLLVPDGWGEHYGAFVWPCKGNKLTIVWRRYLNLLLRPSV